MYKILEDRVIATENKAISLWNIKVVDKLFQGDQGEQLYNVWVDAGMSGEPITLVSSIPDTILGSIRADLEKDLIPREEFISIWVKSLTKL